jgi:predicted AlkP superfamily pyrophosphatase or phosphodiesterase
MSNFLKRTAFLPGLILLLPAAPALKAAPKTKPIRRAQYVFIVSFDGGKPSEMARSKMPRFFSLARQGASTMKARTIVPSVTLPSHTSMLTGVVMEKHKITWNDYRPDAPTLKVPTIFKIAKQAGLKTALFAGKEKFKHLNVRGTLDRFSVPSYKSTRSRARRLLSSSRTSRTCASSTSPTPTARATSSVGGRPSKSRLSRTLTAG